jgi:biopolymer transport protein ExbB
LWFELSEGAGPCSVKLNNDLSGDNMLKMTRVAALAAALLVAVAAAVPTLNALAQAQSAAPAASSPAEPATAAKTPTPAPAAPAGKADAARQLSSSKTRTASKPCGKAATSSPESRGNPGHHVTWQLVHHRHQGLRAGQDEGAARAAEKSFWSAPTVREGAESLKVGSPFRLSPSRDSRHRASTLDCWGVQLNDWITMSIQRNRQCAKPHPGWAGVSATVGSTAPFVGLFGTVWGIYALTAIGIAGQASIDKSPVPWVKR